MSAFDAFARYYDADYGDFSDDLPFYRELARRAGGPVIELMCGSGRVLVPLARAGTAVTGVDISPELLVAARRNLDRAGGAAHAALAVGDVRAPLPGGPYALAIVALNSLMHLETTDDQIAMLRNIHAVLGEGGIVALDLFNPDPRELLRYNGELVLDKTFALDDDTPVQKFVAQSVDMAAQITNVTFLYDELVGRVVYRTTLAFAMRWLYRYELEHLLARCGFAIEAVYGSYDLDAYDSASPLLLVVARKE